MTPTIALLLIFAAAGFACLLWLIAKLAVAVVEDVREMRRNNAVQRTTDENVAQLHLYGRRHLVVVPTESGRAGGTAGRVIGRGTPNGTKH